jgi:hypothetical protein
MLKIGRNTPGWLGALLVHGAVLLIPVSFLAVQKNPWREVEFQLTEEVPLPVSQPNTAPKPKPAQVLRDVPLYADREVNEEFLIKVIDAVRMAGIGNFSILTERR